MPEPPEKAARFDKTPPAVFLIRVTRAALFSMASRYSVSAICWAGCVILYPDADTLLVLHYAGFRVSEIPVTMRERISGVSMHSGWKPIYYVLKMWLAILHRPAAAMHLSHSPVRSRHDRSAQPRCCSSCWDWWFWRW